MSEESHEQDSIEIIHDAICPVCGKNYIPAPFHLYKIYGHARVCSWTCQLKGERENIRIQHGAPRTKQISCTIKTAFLSVSIPAQQRHPKS